MNAPETKPQKKPAKKKPPKDRPADINQLGKRIVEKATTENPSSQKEK